ncbi:MAG TPA: hypothetical protein VGH51_08615 [Candidatus Angelobacter sp.]|jgi:hypothetical protein
MKKQFLISLLLALGMGIAQGQTQSTPAPMQGTGDPVRGAAGQMQRGSAVPAVPSSPTSSSDTAAPNSVKGCVDGSPGNWTLTSDKGKNLILSGTDDQLSQVKGQEVRIQGTEADDGTFKIASIEKVSDSCSSKSQTSSNTGAQSPSTDQNNSGSQSVTSTTATTQSSTTTQPSGTAASSTTPGATTPPVTDQTPANTVGGNTPDQTTAQNPPAGNNAGAYTEQNAAPGNTTSNQPGAASQSTASQDNIRHYSDMDQNSGQKLPQTASPLPLLGLLGLGSLVTGLIARSKK